MYKIYHEDCLQGMKKIKDGSIDMILCDLPYGTTRNSWDSIIPLDELWANYNRVIKENGAICLFAQLPFDKVLAMSNPKMLRYEWIWGKSTKTGFLNAKKMPLKVHENILVFYKKLPTYNPQMSTGKPYTAKSKPSSTNYGECRSIVRVNDGQRYPTDILFFKSERGYHPTQKPVELCEYLIRTYTNHGEIILDNCMGSGTTGVAALRTGRRFIGFEANKKYFDIASYRIKAQYEPQDGA